MECKEESHYQYHEICIVILGQHQGISNWKSGLGHAVVGLETTNTEETCIETQEYHGQCEEKWKMS